MSAGRLHVDPRTLTRLGFPRILRELASRAATEEGRARALEIRPLGDPAAIDDISSQVRELMTLLQRGERLDFDGITDLAPLVQRAEKGGILEGLELVRAARFCHGVDRIRRFLVRASAADSRLARRASELPDLRDTAREIDRVLTDDGVIKDSASPQLAELRARAASLQQGLRGRIDHLKNSLEEFLQDPYYTIWEDRYVLPVIIEKKSNVAGIVHGISRSGATVYIEPQELVDMNNRLKLLKEEIHQMELAILGELSEEVAEVAEPLARAGELLVELDVLNARARLAEHWDGAVPTIVPRGELKLLAARHPILALSQDVVPNNVVLDQGHRLLIISGPNAGGKSVLLSTVGLCVLLASAAIPIPADGATVLPLFSSLYVVLGDLQDLDEHLSTFTGHLSELRRVVSEARADDLMLIDEIITGTDPDQGAALAASFLMEVAEIGCHCLVTTHYQKLKALGLTDQRFLNGAVGMDIQTHRPTYRFAPGLPGISSPLDVARSLGVAPRILERAETMLSEQGDILQKALAGIQEREQEALRLAQDARKQLEEAENLRARHAAALEQVQKDSRKLIATRYEEAVREVSDALTEVRRVVAELQKGNMRAGLVEERRRRVREVEERLTKKAKEFETPPEEVASIITDDRVLKPGEEVFHTRLARKGKVIDGPDAAGMYRIQMGVMTTRVSLTDLALPKAQPKEKPKDSWSRRPPKSNVQYEQVVAAREVDLRGERVEEAVEKLNRALDDAILGNEPELRIIHGHGTGALRAAIRTLLAGNREVVHFRPGEKNEGGDGATIVYFQESAVPKAPQPLDPRDF